MFYSVKALGKIGRPAIAFLIKTLEDKDKIRIAREGAAKALGNIGPDAKEAVPALIKALENDESDVRKAAAEALGNIGPDAKEAISALSVCMHDTDFYMSHRAVTALIEIDGKTEQRDYILQQTSKRISEKLREHEWAVERYEQRREREGVRFETQNILQEEGLGTGYLYGSRARGTAREDSDYDISISGNRFVHPRQAEQDSRIARAKSRIESITGRPVDLSIDTPQGIDRKGGQKMSSAGSIVTEENILYKSLIQTGQDSKLALVLLKGGEFGGLEWSVRERILKRLRKHYDVKIGQRYIPSKNEVLERWGKTGIRDLTDKLKYIEGIDINDVKAGIGFIEALDGDAFDKWIKAILKKYNDEEEYEGIPRIRGLGFLWSYLNSDAQYLALTRKNDKERKDILKDYGISVAEAKQILGNKPIGNVSEQVFVNALLIGSPHTDRSPPGTLRALVGEELQHGVLKKTFQEGLEWGAARTTILASANGIHSAGDDSEVLTDCQLLAQSDAVLYNYLTGTIETDRAPPAIKVSDSSEKVAETNLNSQYDTPPVSPQTPQEIVNSLQTKIDDLGSKITGDTLQARIRRFMLLARKNYLIKAIQSAYQPKGKYTFYHGLIAITRLLPYIVKQIDDTRTNIYLARDGANYWLTKKMMQGSSFDRSRNIIFHLSRAKMGTAHDVMEELIEKTKREDAPKNRFFKALMQKFAEKASTDKEFMALVDNTYKELERAGAISADGRYRIVESMSGGIITGFLKAVILYKQGNISDEAVEEFIVAPKHEDLSRPIKSFDRKAAGIKEDVVKKWFKDAGLIPPVIEIDNIEAQANDPDLKFDVNKLLFSAVEAMVYHLQYPYSEVNLGHPVDFDGENLRKSSEAKQLGADLRLLLIAEGVNRYNRSGKQLDFLDTFYPKMTEEQKQEMLGFNTESVPVDSGFIDQLYPGLTPNQNQRLTLNQKEQFYSIIASHNEIFTTASDANQAELLYNLCEFIHAMGEDAISKVITKDSADDEYAYQFERFLFEMKQLSADRFKDVFSQWLLGGEGTTREDFYGQAPKKNDKGEEEETYYNIRNFIVKMRTLRRAPVKAIEEQKATNVIGQETRRGLAFLRTTAYGSESEAIKDKLAKAKPGELKKDEESGMSNLVADIQDASGFADSWQDMVHRHNAIAPLSNKPLVARIRSPSDVADEAKKPHGMVKATDKEMDDIAKDKATGKDKIKIYRGTFAGVRESIDRATAKAEQTLGYVSLEGALRKIYDEIMKSNPPRAPSSQESPSVTIFSGGSGARLIARILKDIRDGKTTQEFLLYALLNNIDDGGSTYTIVEALRQAGYGITPPIGDQANTLFSSFLSIEEYEGVLDDGARLPKGYSGKVKAFVQQRVDRAKKEYGDKVSQGFEDNIIRYAESVDNLLATNSDIRKTMINSTKASIRNLIVLGALLEAGILQPGKKETVNAISDEAKYQEALDNLAQEFGITWGRAGLSSSDPVTVYAEYDENVLLLKDGKSNTRFIALKRDRSDKTSDIYIRYEDNFGNEQTKTLKPAEEFMLFDITIGNNVGSIFIKVKDQRWQIKETVSEALRKKDITMPEKTELINIKTGETKVLANDGSGRLLENQESSKEVSGIKIGEKEFYLLPRIIKRQTNVTETANFSKVIDFGMLDKFGIDRNPSLKPQKANASAVRRINNTHDMIIMGPGSIFTSLAAHLFSKGIVKALINNKTARKVFVFNPYLDNETIRMSVSETIALIERIASRSMGRKVYFYELFDSMIINEDRADVISCFPEFIGKNGIAMSMHDLESTLGQEAAESILKEYALALNDVLVEENIMLYGNTKNPKNGRFIGLKGSVIMALITQGVDDDKLAEIMDKASARFTANRSDYHLRLRAFVINSPEQPYKAGELYQSMLDIASLPVTAHTPSGSTVSRATYEDALNAVSGKDARISAIDFLMDWQKKQAKPALREHSLLARYRRRAPESQADLRTRNANTITAFLGRKVPADTKEKVNTYIAYLNWAFENNLRGLAISADEVFDIYSLDADSLTEILDNAIYVFAEDSKEIASLKNALKAVFALKGESQRTVSDFEYLWRAWNRGYVEDELVIDYLAGKEIKAGQNISSAARQALSISDYIRLADKKERPDIFKQLTDMLRDKNIINIAGQARSGKSTTAKVIAIKRGYAYLDEGNIRRAYAYKALAQQEEGAIKSLDDSDTLLNLVNNTSVSFRFGSIYIDGEIVSEDKLHTPKIDEVMQHFKKTTELTQKMLECERAVVKLAARTQRVVLAGRGYTEGSSVSIFMKASLKERAKREQKRLKDELGIGRGLEEIMHETAARDEQDKVMQTLDRYPGMFVEFDTTGLAEEAQPDKLIDVIKKQETEQIALIAGRIEVLNKLYDKSYSTEDGSTGNTPISFCLLKGGEFGGLEPEMRKQVTEYFAKIGFKVIPLYRRRMSAQAVVERWGATGVAFLVGELKKDSTITEEEREKGLELVKSKDGGGFIGWLTELEDNHAGSNQINSIRFTLEYLMGDIQQVMLVREKKREEVVKAMKDIKDFHMKDLLKGKDYRKVSEQDFVKAVVGATNSKKSPKGTIRAIVAKQMDVIPLKDNIVKMGKDSFGLEDNTIYTAANGVHIANFSELIREVSLMSASDMEKIEANFDKKKADSEIEDICEKISKKLNTKSSSAGVLKQVVEFLGPELAQQMLKKINPDEGYTDEGYKELIVAFVAEIEKHDDKIVGMKAKDRMAVFTSSPEAEKFVDDPARFTRILMRHRLEKVGDKDGELVEALKVSVDKGSDLSDYKNLRNIFAQEKDIASSLKSRIRDKSIFELFPGLEDFDLLHIERTYDHNSMMSHILRVIDNLQIVDNAARLNKELSSALRLGDRKIAEKIRAELDNMHKQYKANTKGRLDNLTYGGFMELVEFYQNLSDLIISANTAKANKVNAVSGRELIWMVLLLHDIGKSISWPQHIQFSAQLFNTLFERLGWNSKLVALASGLVENHSYISRLGYGEDTYSNLTKFAEDIAANTSLDEKQIVELINIVNIADIRGVGREGRFDPEKLRKFMQMKAPKEPEITPADYKDLSLEMSAALGNGLEIDYKQLRSKFKNNDKAYIEFLAYLMSENEDLAKAVIAKIDAVAKQELLNSYGENDRLSNLLMRRDVMPKVKDGFERKIRLIARSMKARKMLKDPKKGLSIKDQKKFENFLGHARLSYIDAVAGFMEKDEALIKLLVVLWKIWQMQVGTNKDTTDPLMYMAFEQYQNDELKKKKMISLFESSLKAKEIRYISELTFTDALESKLTNIKELNFGYRRQNDMIVCEIIETKSSDEKISKARPVAVERQAFTDALKKIYGKNKDTGKLEGDKTAYEAIEKLEREGRLLIDDTKLDVGPQTIKEILDRIKDDDPKKAERKSIVTSLQNQGLLAKDKENPSDEEIDTALETARHCDTVIKDENDNIIRIFLRPLVLEDMPSYEAAAIILALYKMDSKGQTSHITDSDISNDVDIAGIIVDEKQPKEDNKPIPSLRQQLKEDNETILDLRKEAYDRVHIWDVDWKEKLENPVNSLTKDQVGNAVNNELDIANQKENSIIQGLWEKFLRLKDNKTKEAKTIEESLRDALNILYPKDTPEISYEVILERVRKDIQREFMDGEDIIEMQHRGVAERKKAVEAFKKGDIKKARERLLEAEALEVEAKRLALTAITMIAITLAGEGKDLKSLKQADYNKHFGVVPVIVAGGEGSRRSPDQHVNKSFDEIFGTSNVNRLYSAISFMSVGIRPIIPLGKNTLQYILENEGMYNVVKGKLAKKGASALDELLPERYVSLVKKRLALPDNAILIIKEEDEAGGHGANTHMAMETYAKGDLEITKTHKSIADEMAGKTDEEIISIIKNKITDDKDKKGQLRAIALAFCWLKDPENNSDNKKSDQQIDDLMAEFKKGNENTANTISEYIRWYGGRMQGARMQDVGMFQVHFGEHSPLALNIMIHTALVAFLKSVSERAVATTCSRQSTEMKNKGNFVPDSAGRQAMLGDWHKILMIIAPERIKNHEIERRLKQLEGKGFHHQDMARVEELAEKIRKQMEKIEDWSKVDKETKDKIAPLTKELSEKLQAIFEAAIASKVLKPAPIDKKSADVKKEIELLSFVQEILVARKEALIAQHDKENAFMPINTNKTIFSKELWELSQKEDGKGGTTSKLFEYPSTEDPKKFDVSFLAWEYLLVLSEAYRETPPADRRSKFQAAYPIATVDQGLVGFEPQSFERSGAKDIKTVMELIEEFNKLNRELLDEAGVKAEESMPFDMMDGYDVLSIENRKPVGDKPAEHDKPKRKGVFTGDNVTVTTSGVFYYDYHSTVESTPEKPVTFKNVSIRRSHVKPGTTVTGENINSILINTYLGSGTYSNLYARDTVIPEARKLAPITGTTDMYEIVGLMQEERGLADEIESAQDKETIIAEVINGSRDIKLNLDPKKGDVTQGCITSLAAALWYLKNIKGQNVDAWIEGKEELKEELKDRIAAIGELNPVIAVARDIAQSEDKRAQIDKILDGDVSQDEKIGIKEDTYPSLKEEMRIRAIAQALWTLASNMNIQDTKDWLKQYLNLDKQKNPEKWIKHGAIATTFEELRKQAEKPVPVVDVKKQFAKVLPEISEEESDFAGKFNDTKPSDDESKKIDKGRLTELYDDPDKKKGGVIFDRTGKHFTLKLADTAPNLFKLIGSKNFKGDECSDGTRAFEQVDMDTTSHIGNACYLWDITLRHAYVGKGWGLRNTKARNSVLSDHQLKAKTHPDDEAAVTMLMPVHRNDGHMQAYTAAVDSDFENSFIGVNSGTSLKRMNNRKMLIGVRAVNTIIPEGRDIEPGKKIEGLMKYEVELAEEIRTLSDEDAFSCIERLLDGNDEGRFTSVAVALLLNPQKSAYVMSRLHNRESIGSRIVESANKDAEYRDLLQQKMEVLRPIIQDKIQLSTKHKKTPDTEAASIIKRGMLKDIEEEVLRLAETMDKGKVDKTGRSNKNPWEDEFIPLNEWDKVFKAFPEKGEVDGKERDERLKAEGREKVTIYFEVGKDRDRVFQHSFWVPDYRRVSQSELIKSAIDKYAITFAYWLSTMYGASRISILGPRVLAEEIEKNFKAGARNKYERPDFRIIYDNFEVRYLNDEDSITLAALYNAEQETKKQLKERGDIYMAIAMGTGFACGLSDAKGNVLGYYKEGGMTPIAIGAKGKGHRVSNLEWAFQQYAAQYALIRMAPEAGIDMEGQTQQIIALRRGLDRIIDYIWLNNVVKATREIPEERKQEVGEVLSELIVNNDEVDIDKLLGLYDGEESVVKIAIDNFAKSEDIQRICPDPEAWLSFAFRHLADRLIDLAVSKSRDKSKDMTKEEKKSQEEKDKVLLTMRHIANVEGKKPTEWTSILVELFADAADIELPKPAKDADDKKKAEAKKAYLDATIETIVRSIAKSKWGKEEGPRKLDKDDKSQWLGDLIKHLSSALTKKDNKEIYDITDEEFEKQKQKRLKKLSEYYMSEPDILRQINMLIVLLEVKQFDNDMNDDGLRLKYVLSLMKQNTEEMEWFKDYFKEKVQVTRSKKLFTEVEPMGWARKQFFEHTKKVHKDYRKKATMMYEQIGRYLAEGLYRIYKFIGIKSVTLFGRMVKKEAKIVIDTASEVLKEKYGLEDFIIQRADDLAAETDKIDFGKKKGKELDSDEKGTIVTEYGQAIGAGYAAQQAYYGEEGKKTGKREERYVMLDLGGSDMKIVSTMLDYDEKGKLKKQHVLYRHKHVWNPKLFKDSKVHQTLMKQFVEYALKGSEEGGSDEGISWGGDPKFTLDNIQGIGISWAGPVIDNKVVGKPARIVEGLSPADYKDIAENICSIIRKANNDKPTVLLNDGDAGAVWAAVMNAEIIESPGQDNISVTTKSSSAGITENFKDVIKEMGYSDDVAEKFADIIMNWKTENGEEALPRLKEWYDSCKEELEDGRLKEAEFASRQTIVIKALCQLIAAKFDYKHDVSALNYAIDIKQANCFGYVQMFYALGRSFNIPVQVAEVLESPAFDYDLTTSHERHYLCLFNLADGKLVMVDLTSVKGKPFTLEEMFIRLSDYYRLKEKQEGMHTKIRLLSKANFYSLVYAFKAGDTYRTLSQPREVLYCLDKAIQLNPDNDIAYYHLGVVHDMFGQKSEAITDYTKAININPQFASAYNNRGAIYYELRRFEQAKSDLAQAVEINPKLTEAYNNLGNVYDDTEQGIKAVEAYSGAIEFNDTYIDAYYNRAIAYLKMNMEIEAINDFKRILKLDPTSRDGIIKVCSFYKISPITLLDIVGFHFKTSSAGTLTQEFKSFDSFDQKIDMMAALEQKATDEIDDSAVVEPIKEFLVEVLQDKDEDTLLREMAAYALRHFADQRVIVALKKVADMPDSASIPESTDRLPEPIQGMSLADVCDYSLEYMLAAELLRVAPDVVAEEAQAVIVYSDALLKSKALQELIASVDKGKRRYYLINKQDMSNRQLLTSLREAGISEDTFDHVFKETDPEAIVDKVMPVLAHIGISQVRVLALELEDKAAWSRQRMVDVLLVLVKSKEFTIITPDERNRQLYQEEANKKTILTQA